MKQVLFFRWLNTNGYNKCLENKLLLISINFTPKTSHRFPKKNIVYYVFQVGYWHGSFGSVFGLGSESEQKIDVPHPSHSKSCDFVGKFA